MSPAYSLNNPLRLSLGIIALSLLLGLLGDALLRVTPWGLNALLWFAAATASVAGLIWWQGITLPRRAAWWTLPMLAAAGGYLWRDSATLKALNLLAIGLSLVMVQWVSRGGRPFYAGIFEHLQRLVMTAVGTLLGACTFLVACFFKEHSEKSDLSHSWIFKAARVLAGMLLAVPVVFVFGGLFMSADAIYRARVVEALDLNFEELLKHAMVTMACGWLVAGYLRGLLLSKPRPPVITVPWAWRPFGAIEVNVALALLNALFLSFIVVQIQYLFGGNERVMETAGLTYAEYARQGFFELVTVAALLLPLLLVADWLLEGAAQRAYRLQAACLGVMLLVIMASALKRMLLYQGEFGLTEQRLYTTAFMGWLALALVWFAGTVLRGRRQYFAGGALVAGFIVFFSLQFINPDDLIVRTNLERFRAGKVFDAEYAATLSADAAPALAEGWKELPAGSAEQIATRLAEHLNREGDWRNWNLSRSHARQLVEKDVELQAASRE